LLGCSGILCSIGSENSSRQRSNWLRSRLQSSRILLAKDACNGGIHSSPHPSKVELKSGDGLTALAERRRQFLSPSTTFCLGARLFCFQLNSSPNASRSFSTVTLPDEAVIPIWIFLTCRNSPSTSFNGYALTLCCPLIACHRATDPPQSTPFIEPLRTT
jgi:hypothetical protein